jgi:flagellar hook assembly protein FlgD
MNGRLIKVLADAQMQAGTHQLVWNAKDEKGNAVVAGIYLLKMQTGNYVETKKISV